MRYSIQLRTLTKLKKIKIKKGTSTKEKKIATQRPYLSDYYKSLNILIDDNILIIFIVNPGKTSHSENQEYGQHLESHT